jgi:hypothetical protein
MGLKTRLDGRSEDNSSFTIRNEKGEIVAKIELLDSSGVTLEVTTEEGSYIQKPNGWNSKRN